MSEKDAAVRAALEAGKLIREAWGDREVSRIRKGRIDFVTEIDLRCERLILDALRAAYPDYGFLAEETGSSTGGGSARWIIDPLDGTTNFMKGYPFVAVSIGLEKEGRPAVGVVYAPILDELFVGEPGKGATLNGEPIAVSAAGELGEALLASGFPYDVWDDPAGKSKDWIRLLGRSLSLRCDGSAALDLCHVACGRLDGYWERELSPWDMAAGSAIVEAAGGSATDFSGGDGFLESGEIVAGCPAMNRALREALAATS
jgi:myo-inositol-1(or 4)-monophosphatase